MPLDRLVLIIVCILAGAIATLWVTALLLSALQLPFGWLALIPAGLVGFVIFKVIAQRVGNAEEDHYDRMEH